MNTNAFSDPRHPRLSAAKTSLQKRGTVTTDTAVDSIEKHRRSAKGLRRLLRAHGLIRKSPKTHRYQLTPSGRTTISALLAARQADMVKLAA